MKLKRQILMANGDFEKMIEAPQLIKFAVFSEMAKTQRSGQLPDWFLKNFGTHRISQGGTIWRVFFYMFLKPILATDEAWEEVDGENTIVKTDRVSGTKSYAILWGSYEEGRVDVFEVDVDFASRRVVINRFTELSDMNPEALYLHQN